MRIDRLIAVGVGGVAAVLAFARPASAQLVPPPPTDPGLPPPTDPAPTSPPPTSPGLLPPEPIPVPPEEQATFRGLEQAEREDAGRGLQFFWLGPDVGFQWVSLNALSEGELLDDAVGPGSGLALGGVVGLRWLYYTASARFRYGMLNEFSIWSLGGDFGLRIPLGSFEPYAFVGGGYFQAGSFAADDELKALGATADLAVNGFAARLGGGFDYYVTPVFSTGVSVDVEALFASRDGLGGQTDTVYDASASSVGLGVSTMAVLGLHF